MIKYGKFDEGSSDNPPAEKSPAVRIAGGAQTSRIDGQGPGTPPAPPRPPAIPPPGLQGDEDAEAILRDTSRNPDLMHEAVRLAGRVRRRADEAMRRQVEKAYRVGMQPVGAAGDEVLPDVEGVVGISLIVWCMFFLFLAMAFGGVR